MSTTTTDFPPVPNDRLKRSLKATFLGMAVNAVLSAAKFAAGVLGHSHALIADAVESSADILSSIVVWRALVVAAEPADPEHPYGHGKAEPLAAATIAIMLLLAAGGIILKSLQDFVQPRAMPRAFTLLVLIAVVVVKEILFRFRGAGNAARCAKRACLCRCLASPQRCRDFTGGCPGHYPCVCWALYPSPTTRRPSWPVRSLRGMDGNCCGHR